MEKLVYDFYNGDEFIADATGTARDGFDLRDIDDKFIADLPTLTECAAELRKHFGPLTQLRARPAGVR